MEKIESTKMFIRFTNMVNDLKSLGKSYSNNDHVQKVLQCLPRTWEAKVTAIQEANDLNKLTLEELFSLQMIHELNMYENTTNQRKWRPSPSNL